MSSRSAKIHFFGVKLILTQAQDIHHHGFYLENGFDAVQNVFLSCKL